MKKSFIVYIVKRIIFLLFIYRGCLFSEFVYICNEPHILHIDVNSIEYKIFNFIDHISKMICDKSNKKILIIGTLLSVYFIIANACNTFVEKIIKNDSFYIFFMNDIEFYSLQKKVYFFFQDIISIKKLLQDINFISYHYYFYLFFSFFPFFQNDLKRIVFNINFFVKNAKKIELLFQ